MIFEYPQDNYHTQLAVDGSQFKQTPLLFVVVDSNR